MTSETLGLIPGRRLHCLILLTAAAVCLTVGPALAKPREYLNKSDAWFAGNEARQIATNILSFQSDLGGWPKNVNTTADPYSGEHTNLKPTYDNGATTDELRFLARIYITTHDDKYRAAFDRGMNYVLQGQYPNGGWPQFFPPGTGYNRRITFNDDAMVRLMVFVREVGTASGYDFVDDVLRKQAMDAFDRGVACILKCQIKINGRLTAWCAQHDEIDFQPRSARSYELATLSGDESVGITRLLMSLDAPSPEVIQSVDAAVEWFESAKLTGIRVDSVQDEKGPKGTNKVVVNDPNASPLWSRFYEIETNKPIFVDRDGIPKPALADIGYERRNGYAWYGTWPQKLLDVEYPVWKKRLAAKTNQ